MNHVLKGLIALVCTGMLATAQYFIGQPWRYWVSSAEFVALAVVMVVLWSKTRELATTSREHQARLDAIASYAEKSKVVHDANRIVDAITETLYVQEVREAVESGE